MTAAAEDSKHQLRGLRDRLIEWLVEAAYPCWAARGVDSRNGGFFEVIDLDGAAPPLPRRARVQPRQVYAFARGPAFGWRGDAATIVRRGMHFFTEHYRRPDGLFRTLAAADGGPLDERALLYDQAFALLGHAAAAAALDSLGEFEGRALALRSAVERALGNSDGSLRSESRSEHVRESNPHMHLLEACLAWKDIGNDPGWTHWARELASLALTRLVRADNGAIGEYYRPDWRLAPGLDGRIVEPGHQYEWAWLLLRCEPFFSSPEPLREAALRLIDLAEHHGLRDGAVIMGLLDDWSVKDGNARLWSQTERLKAALLAATLTHQPRYWSMACSAAQSLLPFLATPLPGLWFDVRQPGGQLLSASAPASTFYHLIGSIAALQAAMQESA